MSLHPATPVVIAARRTPIGTAGHALADVDATGLAAPVLRALAARLGELGAPAPQHVILGNCLGPGGNPARVAALAAGLGAHVPGVTVDRQCGSGQEAIHQGAALVTLGRADVVLAGGVESASTAPWRIARPAGGMSWQRALAAPGELTPYDRAPFAPPGHPDPDMGPAAQSVADRCGIDRQRQDDYAVRSHERTLLCAERLAAEIVPIGAVAADERPRRLDRRVLARLPGAFARAGSVTAGNSCGVSDGAAAVAIVPERVRAALGVPGLAILDWAVCAGDPAVPGIAPVPAVRQVLHRAGLGVRDLAALEITEAFAAQVLACTDALGLDPFGADRDRVCAWGGAIAVGHPWGASGALLVVRLFSRLVADPDPTPDPDLTPDPDPTPDPDQAPEPVPSPELGVDPRAESDARFGVATCAIGGGQGLALLARAVGR